jgi:leucyl aminopeptidase
MTTIRLSDGIVKDDVLVVGLAAKNSKSTKSGATSLQIESGDLALDTKALVQALSDLGATGKAEEVIKIPGTSTRLIVFTGLGTSATHYDHEVLRRASGAAARALAGNSSATFSLPAQNIAAVKAIAEGAALVPIASDQFRGLSKSAQQTPLKAITVHTHLAGKSEAKAAIKTAEVIATYTHLVRDLRSITPKPSQPRSILQGHAQMLWKRSWRCICRSQSLQ